MDGGRTDYWAPNSGLDAEGPGQYYQVQSGLWCLVHVNDFIDLDDNVVPEDPIWGFSFQVIELLPTEIVVKMYQPETDLYEPVNVSPSLITNSYVRSPQVEEIPV